MSPIVKFSKSKI